MMLRQVVLREPDSLFGSSRTVCAAVVQFTRFLVGHSRTPGIPRRTIFHDARNYLHRREVCVDDARCTRSKQVRCLRTVTAPGNLEPEKRDYDKARKEQEKWREKGWNSSRPEDTGKHRMNSVGSNRFSQRFSQPNPQEFTRRSAENFEERKPHSPRPNFKKSGSVNMDSFLQQTGRKQETTDADNPKDDKPKTASDIARKLRSAPRTDHESKSPDKETDENDHSESDSKPISPRDRVRDADKRTDIDSKGFRIYRHLVPDWNRFTADDVVHLLKKCVIYDENDIVAINKPYGLPVHGGPSIHHNVARYLPELADALDPMGRTKLHLVHRIDKETTGVLLLARNEKMATILHNMFLRRQIKKQYIAITKTVPQPLEGVINIPIGDSRATGVNRRVLRPVRTDESRLVMNKSSARGAEAITEYEVVGASGHCALVEIRPQTGVQHQIRVHMSHALGCPILGDHKYSHFAKLAPQKLSKDTLTKLKIRQAKVRTLPLFLHASSVTLPEFLDGDNLFINCEVPWFFKHIMSRLKLKRNNYEE
ncbi:ribosomal large subunit pseudouridine synthase D-like [Paramacrobiotus metropolitanus]|uniref:ribosomal large subunit pseudouridine synthase D-like n=1 Tax=Paramacrobiotus metropolitanus TaxID=2943436 RepID=UPI0024460934|nr:ribosomal large subunit pseudouridine synthase D-like [Paramacrobiotus metropolitanus]